MTLLTRDAQVEKADFDGAFRDVLVYWPLCCASFFFYRRTVDSGILSWCRRLDSSQCPS